MTAVDHGVTEEILAARTWGVVRCGLSSQPAPTVSELAREFGLRDAQECYKEICEPDALRLVRRVLHRDLAYDAEIMPEARAAELGERFLAQFGAGARFFTNGTFYEERRRLSRSVWSGPSWEPVTEATFDTGVLVIGPKGAGCVWVEDED